MVDGESDSRGDESAEAAGSRRTERRRRSNRSAQGRRRAKSPSASAPRARQRSSRAPSQRPQARVRPQRIHSVERRHSIARIALGGLALVVLLGVIGFSVTRVLGEQSAARVDVTRGAPVHVVIEQGSTTASIAQQLADLGVVKSVLAFRLHVQKIGVDGRLRAGEYDLATQMAYEDVIDLMLAGPSVDYVDVTIPEGFTAEQVAARLAARGGVDAEEVMRLCTSGATEFAEKHPYLEGAYDGSLEGFLFPATYSIEPDMSPRDVVEMMLEHFDTQVSTIDLGVAESRGLTLGDVVTIASILEREAQLAEEFPLVSSVIYNRLARPMKLQLCATVMYTMPDGTTSLTNKDLEQETPYNTYLHEGLPAGPISNPGLRALQAAAQPAETDYLYYVLTGADGSQTFTATYDEFLEAKRQGQATLGK
ncbi:MAG: endolytic transglycosylase MltG [Coriobacteriia bacterium]|nr:endolytic transglycosylase MltG [Coriobacteriia bacterium]